MTKIKFKLNKNEVKAILFILKTIEQHGQYTGLEGKASIALLKKPYLSLLNRWDGLKQDKNSISISLPEAWALRYQVDCIDHYLGAYEHNVWLKIRTGIYNKVIN